MRIILSTLVFFLLFICIDNAKAQNLREDEVVVIQGTKYISHQVRTGETLYSISKKYNTNQQLIETHNPKVKDGLKVGEMLKIPFVEGTELASDVDQRRAPDGFKTYKIQTRNETPYSIAKQFNISVEELYKYNPKVKKYKKRKKLKIPYWHEVEEEEEDELQPDEGGTINTREKLHTVVSGETLYSLARKYGVSETDIIKNNPGAENLKAGTTLKILIKDNDDAYSRPESIEKDVNVNYLEHIIESGETMWGLTRKYGVEEAKLKALNPILETGFPAGVLIKIPIVEVEKTRAKPINEEAFVKHLVVKGETLYGISKKYELTILELKKYNPVLENRNLVEGETILIPAKPDAIFEQIVGNNKADSARLVDEFYKVELPVEIPETCLPTSSTMFKDKTYSVALFLPLFIDKNDELNSEIVAIDTTALYTQEEVEIAQDTTIELEERKELFKQFYRGSENFVQFYEGVLLAIDTLQKAGVNVRLNVFDTERDANSIRKYIYTDEFLATDLIIGPIYRSVQSEVAEIAAKNRIPIVSPLASQNTIANSNPNYYQVNPSRDYLANKTAEMVADEYYNSNFIIVKTNSYDGTPEGRLVEMFQEKFFNAGFMSNNAGMNFTIYDYENEGAFGLRRVMSETKENVVYIPSSDEGKLSIAISNVNNLARDFSITLIGSNRYDSFSSIQLDNFHNLKLKYVAPYWVDYTNPSTISFIEKFKSNFNTEPNNFGIQGYDVTLYFMTAITAFGNNFSDCLPYLHIKQVQGNYHFEKVSAFGGYMNQGVSVISYTNDYRVVRQRVMGQPRLVAGN